MAALEVICATPHDVEQAALGGAQSIVLCVSLAEGGLTPPLALVRAARRLTDMPLHVPRSGSQGADRRLAAGLSRHTAASPGGSAVC